MSYLNDIRKRCWWRFRHTSLADRTSTHSKSEGHYSFNVKKYLPLRKWYWKQHSLPSDCNRIYLNLEYFFCRSPIQRTHLRLFINKLIMSKYFTVVGGFYVRSRSRICSHSVDELGMRRPSWCMCYDLHKVFVYSSLHVEFHPAIKQIFNLFKASVN